MKNWFKEHTILTALILIIAVSIFISVVKSLLWGVLFFACCAFVFRYGIDIVKNVRNRFKNIK